MKRTPIDDLELQAIVKAEIQNADGYGASAVVGERAENLDYYFARPFGNELEGRSQVVSSDVRETVEWMMPTLIRIFTSGEDVVEFEPEEEHDVDVAKQATEYVNFIWNSDNRGFLNFYSWFKDALISKNGIVKIWWDDTPKQKRERYSGLDEASYAFLVADDSVSVAEHTERQEQVPSNDPSQPPQTITVHDVVITREVPGGKVCVHPVPPEEFLISKEARNIEMARLVGHRRRVTLSELREEGVPEEKLATLASDDASVMTDSEETKRNTVENITAASTTAINTAMRQVWRTEAYIKVDVDGDGIAEVRKVTVAGSGFTILSNEAWEGPRPFATLTPIIMPHRFFGLALTDIIKDIQLIKSTLLRQMLDNLYLSNNQREEVLESAIVDPNELLSSAPGRKIRVKSMGSIVPIPVPPIAEQAIAGLQYLDQIKENRTGVSERTQGLGANDLHDTATGERLLMNAAQGKIELIARVFAETGVRDAFRLILKLICMYQDKPRTVRLTGGWVPMDPRSWNSDMDLRTEVGLGMGDRDQQMMHAQMLGVLQEKALQVGFVSPENLKNTAEIVVNAMGLKGVDRFFTFPQGPQAAMPLPAPQQGQDPAAMAKVQADAQLQQQKQQSDQQLAAAKMQADQQIEQVKAQAKAATDQHLNELEAQRQQIELRGNMELEQLKISSQERIAIEVARINAEAKIEAARISAKNQTDDGAVELKRQESMETTAG